MGQGNALKGMVGARAGQMERSTKLSSFLDRTLPVVPRGD